MVEQRGLKAAGDGTWGRCSGRARSIGYPALGEPLLGVGRAPVHAAAVDLVVQVGSGREALVADLGDLVAGVHDVARSHVVVAHVPVDVDVAVRVLDVHGVAEPGRAAGLEHHAVGGRVDRGAERGGQVEAVVHLAPALAVAGGEAAGGGQHGLGCAGRAGGGELAEADLRLGFGDAAPDAAVVDAAAEGEVGRDAQAVVGGGARQRVVARGQAGNGGD